jgi:2-polyprenyl-6-methoxyphenol hydroxylase-like FAD-dependent oxidoreductase
MLDPQMVAAFPTDSNLVMYACMPTKDRLPEFKRDPEAALSASVANAPDAPPIRESRRVSPVIGKVDMTNRVRGPVAPGLALVGDAALAIDPLWGVGCGWAFQTAEWLADSVAPALRGEEPMAQGLRRYRRRHRRGLAGHAFMIHDYATGRRLNAVERLILSAAARDPVLAERSETFGTRNITPGPRFATSTLGRSVAVNVRHRLLGQSARARHTPQAGAVA